MLVVLVVVVTLEMVRVLFSVGYHMADGVGWVPGGALVLSTFATPAVAPAWRRAAGRAALPASAGLLVVARLAVQAARPVPYWLAAFGTAVALVVLTEMLAITTRPTFGIGLIGGLALDTAVRALGATWDIPWRSDSSAWLLTALMAGGVVVGAVLAGDRPAEGAQDGGVLAGLLAGPFLYLACFYTQSPAFLSSSGQLSLAVAVGVALVDALLAACAVGAAWASVVPRRAAGAGSWMLRRPVVGGALLAGAGWLLPVVTGAWVIVLVVGVQLTAAVLFGAALAESDERPSFARRATGLAGGMLAFGLLALVYQISFLARLPFPARLAPAAAGAMFAVAPAARSRVTAQDLPPVPATVRLLAALAVAVAAAVAVSEPGVATATSSGTVKVMTFNINEAVRDGQLDLGEIATLVRAEQPDVVVLQEVGRGMAVSGMTDEAQWLRRHLRMASVWAPAGDHQLGNLVLTRLPIRDSAVLALGKGAGTQARSAAFVRVDTGGGRDLLVIGAHLQNGSAGAIHATRAREYDAILRRWASHPRTVILGDLNTYPGWPELNALGAAGFSTTQDTAACTMPTSNSNCPDWVFVTSDLGLSEVQTTVERPDHRPVVGTVTVVREG